MTTEKIVLALACAVLIGALLYARERHRERQADNGRRRAAASKEQAERQEGLRQLIRDYGIWPVGQMLLRRWQPETLPHQHVATAQAERGDRARDRLDHLGQQIFRGGDWAVGFVVVISLLGIAWLVFFILQIHLDVTMMVDVGYPTGLAMALGTVIAIGVSALGIIISGMLGSHSLFPSLERWRRSARITAGLVLAIPALALVLALPPLAVYRSQSTLGAQVSLFQKTLAQEESTTPQDPLEIAVTKQDLAAAEQRLEKGEQLDKTLSVVVPMLELVTSPAPVYVGELLVAMWLSWVITDARRRERAARNVIQVHAQRFITDFTDLIVPLGGAPEEADRLLFHADGTELPQPPPQPAPPSVDTPAPNAGRPERVPEEPAGPPQDDGVLNEQVTDPHPYPTNQGVRRPVADPWSLA
jgi:hypothetical protein